MRAQEVLHVELAAVVHGRVLQPEAPVAQLHGEHLVVGAAVRVEGAVRHDGLKGIGVQPHPAALVGEAAPLDGQIGQHGRQAAGPAAAPGVRCGDEQGIGAFHRVPVHEAPGAEGEEAEVQVHPAVFQEEAAPEHVRLVGHVALVARQGEIRHRLEETIPVQQGGVEQVVQPGLLAHRGPAAASPPLRSSTPAGSARWPRFPAGFPRRAPEPRPRWRSPKRWRRSSFFSRSSPWLRV